MAKRWNERRQYLESLECTIGEAADFLGAVDEDLWDGNQTARETLSHLVFWHREYLNVAQALAEGCEPSLLRGTFAELNEAAVQGFKNESMPNLARRLLSYQAVLSAVLYRLPDWSVNFPVKHSGRRKTVAGRLVAIEAHCRYHLRKLQRAQRLGEEWVRAYYEEPG
jgi:hypothetical protein